MTSAPRGSPCRTPQDERPGLLPGGGRRSQIGASRKAKTGRSSVDQGRTGSNHHWIARRHRHPARRHLDRRQPRRHHPADPTASGGTPDRASEAPPAPPEPGAGRPRRRPRQVPPPCLGSRREAGRRPPGTAHGSSTRHPTLGRGTRLGPPAVEHAFAHLHWHRRPRIRWKLRDDIHEAFLTLDADSSATGA